ncbi:MAG: hydroxymethylbilane synthase [Verrucomicrobiota bacterium]|jgi:hydroxymethylbilane synthase
MKEKPILIATRGSPLALAQSNAVLAQCRRAFPALPFELKIIKTSGDKLQAASMTRLDPAVPKGLFTKELETALLKHRADLAVHSLKDLPTDLPQGLILGAVAGKRADVRDVLIYKSPLPPGLALAGFPPGLTVATSSTRRKAQLLASRPDFKIMEIRGNVGTRLRKLAGHPEMDATILAAAGLGRLGFCITTAGQLTGGGAPPGLLAAMLEPDEMLPCVGQAAIGLEIRADDERLARICYELNDEATFQCVTAERAFLRAMGGGCQTPVGAYATIVGKEIDLRAVSFLQTQVRRARARAPISDAAGLGGRLASQLK